MRQVTAVNDADFFQVAKLLADPTRFRLLRAIAAADEMACKRMVAEFDVSQATISHHLKELAAAGLIEGRREGQCGYFKARHGAINRYHRELGRRLGGEG